MCNSSSFPPRDCDLESFYPLTPAVTQLLIPMHWMIKQIVRGTLANPSKYLISTNFECVHYIWGVNTMQDIRIWPHLSKRIFYFFEIKDTIDVDICPWLISVWFQTHERVLTCLSEWGNSVRTIWAFPSPV